VSGAVVGVFWTREARNGFPDIFEFTKDALFYLHEKAYSEAGGRLWRRNVAVLESRGPGASMLRADSTEVPHHPSAISREVPTSTEHL